MNKKILIISAALIIMLLLIFAFFVLGRLKTPGGAPAIFPTPTPIPIPSGAVPGVKNTPLDKQKSERLFLVGQLIPKLPYHGANFSFYYNFGTNQFILYINPSASSDGNVGFDAFLKQNGVDDRSWIENLTVINKNVTPAP